MSICLLFELSVFESFCNLGDLEELYDRFRVANTIEYGSNRDYKIKEEERFFFLGKEFVRSCSCSRDARSHRWLRLLVGMTIVMTVKISMDGGNSYGNGLCTNGLALKGKEEQVSLMIENEH